MKIRFNLLPTKQKKHLRTQKVFRMIMEQEIHVFIIIFFLILSLFAMYFVLKTETSIMEDVRKSVTEKESYQEIAAMHEKFKNIHQKMNASNTLNNGHILWSQLFVMLSENITDDISVNSIKTAGNIITIQAVADARESVISLKDRFRNVERDGVKCFTDIVVPESQLTVPFDVTFTMTFKVNLACLK